MRRYSLLLAAALALTLLFAVGAAQAAPPTFHIDLYAGSGAGNPGDDESPDGTLATEAEIFPSNVAVAPDGTVYFTSSGSVRYVDANGDVQTLAAGIGATKVAVRSDGVVFADAVQSDNSCPGSTTRRIVEIYNGVLSNFVCQLGGDSSDQVEALAIAPEGGLYYSEIYSVWKTSPDGGSQTLIAGTPFSEGYNCQAPSDPPNWTKPATSCSFSFPTGLAAYGGGVLVVASNWHQVRYVVGGWATPFAGDEDYHYGGDGGSAITAGVPYPISVTVLADGSVLIGGHSWVRHVGADGTINRVAGVVGSTDYSGDGGPALDAHVGSVTSLAPAGGHVYLVDANHYRIRRLDRDSAPPDTALTAHPAKYSNVASATFGFSSTQDGSSFSCKLDGADWSACTSSQGYDGLAEGAHVFRVRATNAFGETDPTPVKFSWTVDLTPPETTITAHPDKSTTSTSATFQFASSEAGSKFKCKLDDGAYETCASPKTYDGLAVGAHAFKVFAIDRAGNRDGTAASFKWTITS